MAKKLNWNVPRILYKYVSEETAFKILQNKTIRFSNPKCFNDPYDSNIPIILEQEQILDRNYFTNLLKQIEYIKDKYKSAENSSWSKVDTTEMRRILESEEFIPEPAVDFVEKTLQNMKNNMRVLSLSEVHNNLLMWGHYANNNKGVVLGFNTQNLFLYKAAKVQYQSDIPKISNVLLNDILIEEEDAKFEMHKIFNSKSIDWQYEQEWRYSYDVELIYNYLYYVREIRNFNNSFLQSIKNKQDIIDNPIMPQNISEIYIGAKMNILDENKIIQYIKREYAHVKLFKMELSKEEFKLIPRMIKLING